MKDRGYEMTEYDWDERTGVASLVYERTINGVTEREIVNEPRPTRPEHECFDTVDHSLAFNLRSREDMIYDSLWAAVGRAYG